jgi:hypothetical protein
MREACVRQLGGRACLASRERLLVLRATLQHSSIHIPCMLVTCLLHIHCIVPCSLPELSLCRIPYIPYIFHTCPQHIPFTFLACSLRIQLPAYSLHDPCTFLSYLLLPSCISPAYLIFRLHISCTPPDFSKKVGVR